MAYFGRTPKKPGSVPGSQSGFKQQAAARRELRAIRSLVTSARPERPGTLQRASRALRGGRAGRQAR